MTTSIKEKHQILQSVKTEQAKYKCISFDKIVSKFVGKLLKYRILFTDILTFLGLDYRDASLIILYVVLGTVYFIHNFFPDNYNCTSG